MAETDEDPAEREARLKQHKEFMALARDEWKTRRGRELLLVMTCAIVLFYAYPIDIGKGGSASFDKVIEISPLSIKLPLGDAIAIFPTIIAAIYLVYLSSSSKVNAFTALAFGSLGAGRTDVNEDRVSRAVIIFVPAAVTLADPDRPIPLSTLGQVAQFIPLFFVGLIFSVLPYATIALATFRGWQIFEGGWLLVWNILCIAIMILAVVGQIFSASKERPIIY